MSTPPRFVPVGPRRALAGAALLCLIGYAFNLAHLVVVQHTTCIAHDEVVHGTAEATEAVAPSLAIRPFVPREDHGRDHCLALTLTPRSTEAARDPHPLMVPPPRPAHPLPAKIVGLVPAPVPLLALAPKSSPPANG